MATFSPFSKWYSHACALGLILGSTQSVGAQTSIAIDAKQTHQNLYGFGATTISLAFGATDNVPSNLRAQAIQALYRDVRLNTGNLAIEPSEAPAANVFAPANDNDDPAVINPAGFNWIQSTNMHDLVVVPGSQYGFDAYFLGPAVSTIYALSWVNAYRTTNYNRYLDEIAEHVTATAMHWRDTYGITQPLMMLFNEPTSGNGELVGGDATTITDIVARAGARIRAAGFANMRFVVPSEEREDISLDRARRVLGDANARPYVGAIGYHPYPYGSTYAAVANILATSGMGTPDPGKVALRNQLRDLGAMYNVPVFMTEVSHSEKPIDDFDNVRGRAIHIHDELVYADAAAFFGMNAMWDSVSHAQHFQGRPDPGFYSETDTIVLIDVGMSKVVITPMGRAIGHYARWIRRGATRVDATTSDPLVLVTGLVDSTLQRLVAVAINNFAGDRMLDIAVSGVELTGTVEGELSRAGSLWTPVAGVAAANGHVKYTLPSHGVVTLSAAIRTGSVPDGGTDPTSDAGSSQDASRDTTDAARDVGDAGGMKPDAAGQGGNGGSSGGAGSGSSVAAGGGGSTGGGSTGGGSVAAGGTGVGAGGKGGSSVVGSAGGMAGTASSGGTGNESTSGCGCRTASSSGKSVALLLAGIVGCFGAARRRSRSKYRG